MIEDAFLIREIIISKQIMFSKVATVFYVLGYIFCIDDTGLK